MKRLITAALMIFLVLNGCSDENEHNNTTASQNTNTSENNNQQQSANKPQQPTNNPQQPTNNPQQPTDNPQQPTDNPQQPTDNPQQPTDNPQQPTDNPQQPTDNPQQPTDNPQQPTDNPQQPTDNPQQPTDNPQQPTDNPQQPTDNPQQPTDNPQQPSDNPQQPTDNPQQPSDNPQQEESVLKAKIDDTVITVEWENNEAVKALSKIASESAVTINMSQYGGFEQVGPLGQFLPRNDSQTTTAPGDIVLYSGNQIVVFYGSNTWSYTRLGKITDKTEAELKTILDKEKVTLTLSANSDEPTTEPEQPEKKSLVAYFSVTHNTKTIAEYISEYTGSTLYEIVPKHPYTSEDINYSDNSSRTSIEQNDPNARPEIASTIDDIDQYDVIYLGYPIWWGQAPKIMYSFLESVTIKEDAVIVPFCTSGSSPIGMSATNLKQSANAANWLEGRRFAASTDKTTVTQWIDSLNLK